MKLLSIWPGVVVGSVLSVSELIYCLVILSRENELLYEGGSSNQRVPEHNIGADENAVRIPRNDRRAQAVSSRVSGVDDALVVT